MKNDQKQVHNPFPRNEKGFMGAGQAELMILVAIIAVILAVGIPQLSQYKEKKYEAYAIADLRNARDCLTAYAAHHKGEYPESLVKAAEAEKTACPPPSEAVTLEYKRTTIKVYEITASHKSGKKKYKLNNNDETVYYRFNDVPAMVWQKL